MVPTVIRVRFYEAANYGDQLSLVILQGLARQWQLELTFQYAPTCADADVVGIGSISNGIDATVRPGTWVWTTGSAWPHWQLPQGVLPSLRILGLRGKHTAAQYGLDASTTLLGDGGLLLPRVWPREQFAHQHGRRWALGLVPHVVDWAKVRDHSTVGAEAQQAHSRVRLIDLSRPPREVTAALLQCDAIVSSSLHGCIVADAYGIPNVHAIVYPNQIVGGGFKFRDYYSAFSPPPAAETLPPVVNFDAPSLQWDLTWDTDDWLPCVKDAYVPRPGLALIQQRLYDATSALLHQWAGRPAPPPAAATPPLLWGVPEPGDAIGTPERGDVMVTP